MEADSQVLLVLIAVRLSGKRPVPAADEPFKMLKKSLQLAVDHGFVEETEVAATDKKGKPTKKTIRVIDLTAKGEAHLKATASPDAQAAIAVQQHAARAQSQEAERVALRQQLDADRETLRKEVVAALSGKTKGKGDEPAKAVGDLAKTVKQLAERLGKIELTLQSRNDDVLLARIDQAFAALQQKLAGSSEPLVPSSKAIPHSTPQEPLTNVLRRSYCTLRQFAEFNDGLVPIPRLFHEARRSLPQLSVEALHRELLSMWERREIELKVLNEVRLATEPDKGITRGENLYYYVYWQNP